MTLTTTEERFEPPRSSPALFSCTAIGNFERASRISGGASHDEWIAVLPDETEVVVSGSGARPVPLEVQKAISVVQSRSYLGKRAVQLIAPFIREEGKWRLLTIDFGAEARRHGSEFLMCFAFVARHATLSRSSPYFEVGFSLPARSMHEDGPTFDLAVKAIIGMPMPFP